MKNKPDPIALEDWQYPPWLWTLLQPKSSEGASADEDGDLYGELYGLDDPPGGSCLELCILILSVAKSKKQRRAAAKRLRKEEKNNMYKEKKIPIYEQTVDLPTSDGTLEGAAGAEMAREVLTRAMRKKRRADIKESNFLKTMR